MNDLYPDLSAGTAAPDELTRSILAHLPAAAYLCDREGLITYFNGRAAALWGREPALDDPKDRFCGSFKLFGVDGTPIRHDRCWMALALCDGRDYAGEPIVIERPDGTRRRALAHATPLRKADGSLSGAINVLVDITAETETRQRLAVLLESIDDHFVQYDREWRYVFVTEKGAALIGKTPQELLGRSIWDVFPDAVGNPYWQHLHEVARTRRTLRFEHYYAPLGRWFDNHIYPTDDGVAVFATDITGRKAAQAALQQAEARHAALLDLVPAGVYRCDAEGYVRYFNNRAAELWGRVPDLSAGERYCGSLRLFTVDGTPLPHASCPMAQVLATGMPVVNQEAIIERPDGTRATVLVNIEPLRDDDGKVAGAVNVLQDITERKAAEAELRRSRQELAEFVENAAEGLHWVDENGIIQWANRAELEMLGYAPHEYIGRSIRDFHADADNIECILQRLRAGDVLRDHEAVMRCKDGSLRHVSISSSVMWENGRFAHTCCFTRDVTARRHADEMRSQLAAIVESSQDAIVGKDLAGRVTSWNAAAERLYGYTAAEVLGRTLEPLYRQDEADNERRLLERVRRGERIQQLELVRIRKDGQPIEVSLTVSPVHDGNGRIVGISVVSRDVSGRKAHERALGRSEERYRSLAEASGAIVFTSDAQARWQVPVPAWEAYTGQSFEDYRGHGWAQAIHPEDRQRVQAQVDASVRAGTVNHVEGRLWHAPSRSYRWQEARVVPIMDAAGRVAEWIGAVVDIHVRKAAEEALREADRRKDEFLAILAHELRNPLAPIVSSLQILRLPNAQAARGAVLDVMDRQVGHLVRLLDDLMEVSRITRGAIELQREAMGLEEVVRAAVEIGRSAIEGCGHALDVSIAPGPIAVHGDRVRLAQIVANLLNNAAKYTPRGGHIRVAVEMRRGRACVIVADDGVGIEPHAQERIFEMFERGAGSRERFAAGLGIGLGLARKLAELHGGTLTVSSAGEGRGSEFLLSLPLSDANVPAAAAALPLVAAQRTLRVLVADDNRDAADSLAGVVRLLGHEVRVAHDGSQALHVAEEFRPQVALLDLGMPGRDGFELAQLIRSRPWGTAMRLVAVSGWGQEGDRERSRRSGFDVHLVKPVMVDQLRAVTDG